MNVLQLISKRLYQGERVIAIVTFISMMLIMFIQVFFRYVVQSSLAWSEEAMRYLFVITSYFGAACATYEHKHVVIDFLGTICGKFVKGEKRQEAIFSAVDVLVSIVCCGFFIYMSSVMFTYSLDLQAKNHLSTAMLIPLCYVGYAVVAAMVLCAVHYFIEIFTSAGIFSKDLKEMKEGKQ
ncbi:TRAP-type C4-dicarboxylate transport system%2C small permease component [uncultured Flavonifractor sp.]|uniref:TRAP transporter small permease subunit n=1 Tax=Flintibacter hominis TaxID=2763048 RepID=A0A8J6MCS2_9FIRM|nr:MULTISPECIES: TRAP transporter small permease subunit [Eubacteriales]SCH43530.1 TRAP-type C4-dicarboxylate transport system%2C small permease component [uncultured Clostridium sp.]SCI61581.1 TRAP-type C4-dicarboxylate transport system%2C small permease component [uncultured Flavonifractor sp.]MBC5722151.1 TRAP transporter small permease subunit [Flintibacter hominis]MCU6701465.1 TRAP transporter small permease subunit [Muriventricola aceti]SCI74559.1 TRAP-type C4-dicarboxylate transport sys